MQTIYTFLNKYSKYSLTILRVALGIVFIFFGWTSVTNPGTFAGLVPDWTAALGTAESLVRIHGVVEIVLGLLLILCIHARIVALILFIDLLHILTLLKFGPVWIRDFGLAGSMLALALHKRE